MTAALNQWIADRKKLKDVIHHIYREVQYLFICYTNRIAESNVIASVGTGDYSQDNALAETVNSLCKTEVVCYLKEN